MSQWKGGRVFEDKRGVWDRGTREGANQRWTILSLVTREETSNLSSRDIRPTWASTGQPWEPCEVS